MLYHKFDLVLVLAHGRALYSGAGGFAPVEYFSSAASGSIPPYQQGYNVAEYLLEVASDAPVGLFQAQARQQSLNTIHDDEVTSEKVPATPQIDGRSLPDSMKRQSGYATTFLSQFQYLCGREWKNLQRDKTLFLAHVLASSVLGVFCGSLSPCCLLCVVPEVNYRLQGVFTLVQARPLQVFNLALGVCSSSWVYTSVTLSSTNKKSGCLDCFFGLECSIQYG